MGKAEVVCFDKTGTLTTNQPRIEAILNFSDMTENELLLWAYSAEMHNHHPLALAIKHEAVSRGIDPFSHIECDFTLGKGVKATIGHDVIRLGNRRYLDEAGIDTMQAGQRADGLNDRGLTVIFLAKNDAVLAALGFANELRPDAAATVRELYRTGVSKVALVTGDTANTALSLCESLGIDECRHSVLPEQKADIVRELKNGDRGDHGRRRHQRRPGPGRRRHRHRHERGRSDVAIEAADIALVKDDLADILYVRDLSRQTLRVARQNFWIATSTNLGGAVAGALGILSPVAAGLLHIVHTLGVLANSSRLLAHKPAIPLPAAPSGEAA